MPMKSKVRGVSFHSKKSAWRVVLPVDGKPKHLGYFAQMEEAEAFSLAQMQKIFGEVKVKPVAFGAYPAALIRTYNKMYDRCFYESEDSYKYYGGRGITVCSEWLSDANTFYLWAQANGWAEGLQLDRINTNGNYEPANCRFVTQLENVRNRREQLSEDVGLKQMPNGRWRAHIRANRRLHHLGTFDSKEAAREARIKGEATYWSKDESSTA